MMLLATVAVAGGSIYSGMAANQQGQEQKKLYEEQARVQREETATATTMKSDDRRRMLASQRMAYLANGVELTGTPLVVGDDTFNEYQKEIDALKTSGAAKSYLLSKQGEQAATSGRTQLVSSLFSAGSTVAQSGLFK
jgi:hypothetical protein